MANLSYQEALSKGLVYPGDEQAALKLTGGGKGFASVEDYKKTFDTSYAAKKSEVDALRGRINEMSAWNTKANELYNYYMTGAKGSKAIIAARNVWYSHVANSPLGQKTFGKYEADPNRIAVQQEVVNEINRLSGQAKSLSGTMETAMGKYQAATKSAIETEKRQTGEMSAARKRLVRGTAGIVAKAVGGVQGGGLPKLGEGSSMLSGSGLLGQEVKL